MIKKSSALRTLMLCTATSLALVQGGGHGAAFAQQSGTALSLSIPAQDLGPALTRLADQTGMGLIISSNVVAGKRSAPLSGSYTVSEAFARILAGTGLDHHFEGATVVIESGGQTASDAGLATDLPAGALVLDTITVFGGSGKEDVYYTPGATAYIAREDIDRFRGASPADMFRGTAGVMAGEARNGAGGMDVNIRGMQGMGRVATTIDGAENSMQVYQGYQGISNRSFVDPDLLADVEITKGSDITTGAIAGTVAMRTLDAADVVKEGETLGFRLKTEVGSNTTSPTAGSTAGYAFRNVIGGVGTATPSPDGMDRPGPFKPTQGSISAVAALKTDNVDFLAGYAYRSRGNYYAGTHGPVAEPEWIGGLGTPQGLYYDYVQNAGILNYRGGEEVLNSELETRSWIAKGTLRFGDGHSLQYAHTGYRSEAGDFLARRLTSNTGQAVQEAQTTGTRLESDTLKYRWNPADNDLVNLKADLWMTRLESLNPPRWGTYPPESFGLPADYRVGSKTTMWGLSIDNTSVFDTAYGQFDLDIGISYKDEDVRPRAFTEQIEYVTNARSAERKQQSAYAKLTYTPSEWLTVNGGIRYDRFSVRDRKATDWDTANPGRVEPFYVRLDDEGFSGFLGASVEPWSGTQLFVNYSNALRLPSLFESSSSFVSINTDIQPERASNWEIGANLTRDSIFAGNDEGMVKLSFFDWNIKDYIGREWYTDDTGVSTLRMHNIDRARFQGLELAGRYSINGFTAELAANRYTKVEFCRTATTCGDKSLYADYATNQIPPKYTVDLTLSQKLMDDALTLGGRVSRIGPRAIGHGDVTAQGLGEFIALVDWKAYTLVDVFAEYEINDRLSASFRVENLGDTFFVDPISIVAMPGPGRTVYAGLNAKF